MVGCAICDNGIFSSYCHNCEDSHRALPQLQGKTCSITTIVKTVTQHYHHDEDNYTALP